jgi:hypothetical protein
MSRHVSHIAIWRLGLTNQFSFFNECSNNLFRPAQNQQTNAHNDRTTDHDRSPTTPFRGALVGHDTHDWLHDQSRQWPSYPNKREFALGKTELQQVRSAISHLSTPCEPVQIVRIKTYPRAFFSTRTYCKPIKLNVSSSMRMDSLEPLTWGVPCHCACAMVLLSTNLYVGIKARRCFRELINQSTSG